MVFQLICTCKSHSEIYQQLTQSLNCTPLIPIEVFAYLKNNTPLASDQILLAILTECLSEQKYDTNVPAVFFNEYNRILFGISISEVVSLEFNGDLQVKVNLDYQWEEPRFRWQLDSGINNWTWPQSTMLHISQVWPFIFEVLNCPLQNCELRPQNQSHVYVNYTGTVELQCRS